MALDIDSLTVKLHRLSESLDTLKTLCSAYPRMVNASIEATYQVGNLATEVRACIESGNGISGNRLGIED